MRVASNGRLARCGASLSADSAESRQKPAMPTGLIIESKPPASTRSTRPRRIILSAVPSACPPDAHAVWTDVAYPRMP